ncbi:MAG: class I SAM-dependent methyltransferase [Nitrososphaeraceae archaeon]
MTDIWDKVYAEDNSFFGDEPSHFAHMCYDKFYESNNIKRILELGCGQGRDALYFAAKGFQVYALDSSKIGIESINSKAKESGLSSISIKNWDAKQGLPFDNDYFDAVYSHMLFNMGFKYQDLQDLLKEVNRTLKNNGFHCFSIRSDNDKFYRKGKETDSGVFEINGFHIRFFTKKEIQDLEREHNFEIDEIVEEYEEPVSLYLVTSRKISDLT